MLSAQLVLLTVLILSPAVVNADKVNPRRTTSVEAKATSRNQPYNKQSASEVNVHGLQEDTHARSIGKGDRNTISKSFGNTHTQDKLDFADVNSHSEQDGVGTTISNSELTSNFLVPGEKFLPLQNKKEIFFERAGGFPTEISLNKGVLANNRVYRNSGASSLGRNPRSSASIVGSTILNLQTITSENNAQSDLGSILSAGLGFAEGRENQTGSFESAIANGKEASVTNQSAQHSNSRAAKSETQSVANAIRTGGTADTAVKTQAVNIGNGSAFGQAVTRNDELVSSTLANSKAYRSNFDVVRSH